MIYKYFARSYTVVLIMKLKTLVTNSKVMIGKKQKIGAKREVGELDKHIS